jgi:hypothetical protein
MLNVIRKNTNYDYWWEVTSLPLPRPPSLPFRQLHRHILPCPYHHQWLQKHSGALPSPTHTAGLRKYIYYSKLTAQRLKFIQHTPEDI